MSAPTTLLAQAQAEGLTLRLTPPDRLKLAGDPSAVARWAPILRPHKPSLIALLTKRHHTWDVTEPDGAAWSSCYAPPQTWAEVLSRYAPGTAAVPIEDPDEGHPLPPDIEAAVLAWLDQIGEDCPDIRREVLGRARDVPEARADYLSRARPATPQGPNHEGTDPSGTDPQQPNQ